MDECLRTETFTSKQLETFTRASAVDNRKTLTIAARVQVTHWMNVVADWKKLLSKDWERTYAAINTIYVTRSDSCGTKCDCRRRAVLWRGVDGTLRLTSPGHLARELRIEMSQSGPQIRYNLAAMCRQGFWRRCRDSGGIVPDGKREDSGCEGAD